MVYSSGLPQMRSIQMLKYKISATSTILLKRLTSLNCRSENVIVKAIIIPELELRNVKMQVFLADVVKSADDTALENAPKTLNRLGVNRADNVLMFGVVNGPVRETEAKVLIAQPIDRCRSG